MDAARLQDHRVFLTAPKKVHERKLAARAMQLILQ